MVLNKNIMYLPPCEVVAAGSDIQSIREVQPRRNIMQAGLPNRDLATIRAEYEQLKKEVDAQFLKLEQTNNNIRQAGLYGRPSDQQVFETFQAFSNNEDAAYDLPKLHNNVMVAGIKQAAAIRQPPNDFEMLQTFMEFGGLS